MSAFGAKSISARKAVEPFLERRIGESSVVTRVRVVWDDYSDAQHNPRRGEFLHRGQRRQLSPAHERPPVDEWLQRYC
jgi:hypothetical protein